MKHASKIAGVVFATLILSTALVQAGALIDVTPEDHTPVSVDTYDPPVDVDTYDAPVDVDTYDAPIDVDPFLDHTGPTLVNTKPKYVPGLVDTKQNKGLRRGDLLVAIGCEVSGTPSEFPDDLLLVNQGNAPLAAGTAIKWQVKGTGLKGYFALNADIAAGAGFKASGILGGGVEAGLPCTAKVI